MAGEFTELTGLKLGQAALTTTVAIIYETPVDTRTYIKDIMVANHSGPSGSTGTVSVYIVPAGGAASNDNELIGTVNVVKQEYLHWSGLQITNPGDTIQAVSDGTELTITISGAEAV